MNDDFKNGQGDYRPDIVYSNTMSSQQLISTIKIVLFYAFELVFWLIVSKMYAYFGNKWIVPSVSAMWIMGAITTFYIKEEKEATIKQTKWTVLGFLAFLFLYRGVIQLIAPISSEQMSAALNITIPAASGMAAAGMLQNILLIVSVMTPIGYLIWCAQKFKTYHGRATKQEAFQKIKGIRENQRRF
jgi:hypothetical protein